MGEDRVAPESRAEAASLDRDELRKLRAIEKAARDLNTTMPDLGDGDPMSDLDDALADYDEWLDAQDRALLSAGDKAEAPPKPRRERIDWKNVVVDEGDEAP